MNIRYELLYFVIKFSGKLTFNFTFMNFLALKQIISQENYTLPIPPSPQPYSTIACIKHNQQFSVNLDSTFAILLSAALVTKSPSSLLFYLRSIMPSVSISKQNLVAAINRFDLEIALVAEACLSLPLDTGLNAVLDFIKSYSQVDMSGYIKRVIEQGFIAGCVVIKEFAHTPINTAKYLKSSSKNTRIIAFYYALQHYKHSNEFAHEDVAIELLLQCRGTVLFGSCYSLVLQFFQHLINPATFLNEWIDSDGQFSIGTLLKIKPALQHVRLVRTIHEVDPQLFQLFYNHLFSVYPSQCCMELFNTLKCDSNLDPLIMLKSIQSDLLLKYIDCIHPSFIYLNKAKADELDLLRKSGYIQFVLLPLLTSTAQDDKIYKLIHATCLESPQLIHLLIHQTFPPAYISMLFANVECFHVALSAIPLLLPVGNKRVFGILCGLEYSKVFKTIEGERLMAQCVDLYGFNLCRCFRDIECFRQTRAVLESWRGHKLVDKCFERWNAVFQKESNSV